MGEIISPIYDLSNLLEIFLIDCGCYVSSIRRDNNSVSIYFQNVVYGNVCHKLLVCSINDRIKNLNFITLLDGCISDRCCVTLNNNPTETTLQLSVCNTIYYLLFNDCEYTVGSNSSECYTTCGSVYDIRCFE